MSELILKYSQLDSDDKKQVLDFINALFQKARLTPPSLSNYKKRILNVSVWTEEDEQNVNKGRELINQMTPELW